MNHEGANRHHSGHGGHDVHSDHEHAGHDHVGRAPGRGMPGHDHHAMMISDAPSLAQADVGIVNVAIACYLKLVR